MKQDHAQSKLNHKPHKKDGILRVTMKPDPNLISKKLYFDVHLRWTMWKYNLDRIIFHCVFKLANVWSAFVSISTAFSVDKELQAWVFLCLIVIFWCLEKLMAIAVLNILPSQKLLAECYFTTVKSGNKNHVGFRARNLTAFHVLHVWQDEHRKRVNP